MIFQNTKKGGVIKGRIISLSFLAILALSNQLYAGNNDNNETKNDNKNAQYNLDKIVVNAPNPATGTQTDGYKVDTATTTGPWGDKAILDTPYSVSSTPSELIENMIIPNTDKIIQYSPVATSSTNSATGEGFTGAYLRGFNNSEVMRDGIHVYSWLSSTIADIDHVEILTGLSGFLYGAGNVGGAVNLVTKRPTKESIANITVGNYGGSQLYTQIDAGGLIDKEGKFGYRINALTSDGDTVIKGQSVKENLISAAFDWHILDNLLFQVDASHQEYHVDKPTASLYIWGAPEYLSADSLDNKKSYTYDWTYSDLKTNKIGTNLTWDINDIFSVRSGYQYYTEDNKFKTATFWLNASNGVYVDSQNNPYKVDNDGGYLYLDSRFDTFGIEHKMTFGTNYSGYKLHWAKVSTWTEVYYPDLNAAFIAPETNWVDTQDMYVSAKQKMTNLMIGDDITINDKWSLMIGINHASIDTKSYNTSENEIDSYNKSANTPTASIIYKPIDNISTYVTYIESLEAGETVGVGYTNTGDILNPTMSKEIELGVKAELGRMLLTTALYQIDKANTYDKTNSDHTLTRTQDGREVHKGIEFICTGKATDNLTLFGGATYLDAKVTKSNSITAEGTVPNIPKHKETIYAEYRLPFYTKLFITGGVIHVGEIEYVPNTLNTRETLPASTTIDAGLRYETKIYDKPLVARLNVSNLTDEHYYTNASGNLGTPLTVSYSMTMKF